MFYTPGLVGDGSLVQFVQVIPHAHSQPVAQLPAVHGVQHTEHLPTGEAQADVPLRLVVEVCTDVEGVSDVGLHNLPVNYGKDTQNMKNSQNCV